MSSLGDDTAAISSAIGIDGGGRLGFRLGFQAGEDGKEVEEGIH